MRRHLSLLSTTTRRRFMNFLRSSISRLEASINFAYLLKLFNFHALKMATFSKKILLRETQQTYDFSLQLIPNGKYHFKLSHKNEMFKTGQCNYIQNQFQFSKTFLLWFLMKISKNRQSYQSNQEVAAFKHVGKTELDLRDSIILQSVAN